MVTRTRATSGFFGLAETMTPLPGSMSPPPAGLVPDGRVTPQALRDLLDPLLEPLRHDEFTFSRSWLRGQTTRFSDPRSSVSRTQRRLRAPIHHLLVQRVASGTTGVLCLLGATVHVANEAAKWLPGLNSQS